MVSDQEKPADKCRALFCYPQALADLKTPVIHPNPRDYVQRISVSHGELKDDDRLTFSADLYGSDALERVDLRQQIHGGPGDQNQRVVLLIELLEASGEIDGVAMDGVIVPVARSDIARNDLARIDTDPCSQGHTGESGSPGDLLHFHGRLDGMVGMVRVF